MGLSVMTAANAIDNIPLLEFLLLRIKGETVQYLAGHRYISSVGVYQLNEKEELSEEVNKFHPLG